VEWHHQSSQLKKKFKVQISAVQAMARDFWDSGGILLSTGILGGHRQIRAMRADI